MKISSIIKADVEVEPLDCIDEMLLNLCHIKYISDLSKISIENNSLSQRDDISYHGSPVWEDTVISSNIIDVKAFESLIFLKEYYESKNMN